MCEALPEPRKLDITVVRHPDLQILDNPIIVKKFESWKARVENPL